MTWIFFVSTVTKILKNKLKMKYKKFEKTNVRTLNLSSKRFMAESLSRQLELFQENYELIWVDEFPLSSRASNMHEWCMVGKKRYVNFHVNAFWMNFIVAFLEEASMVWNNGRQRVNRFINIWIISKTTLRLV